MRMRGEGVTWLTKRTLISLSQVLRLAGEAYLPKLSPILAISVMTKTFRLRSSWLVLSVRLHSVDRLDRMGHDNIQSNR